MRTEAGKQIAGPGPGAGKLRPEPGAVKLRPEPGTEAWEQLIGSAPGCGQTRPVRPVADERLGTGLAAQ